MKRKLGTAKPVKDIIAKTNKKPSGVEKLVQDVTNRYRVTAKEARDIVTAVSNAGKTFSSAAKNPTATTRGELAKSAKNVVKQVAETGQAAATGKKGTTAGATFKGSNKPDVTYVVKGKKR